MCPVRPAPAAKAMGAAEKGRRPTLDDFEALYSLAAHLAPNLCVDLLSSEEARSLSKGAHPQGASTD